MKFGTFLCLSLVLDAVSCFEGSLTWSARFWERRGFRVVITAEESAEMPTVLCVQWCLRLKGSGSLILHDVGMLGV